MAQCLAPIGAVQVVLLFLLDMIYNYCLKSNILGHVTLFGSDQIFAYKSFEYLCQVFYREELFVFKIALPLGNYGISGMYYLYRLCHIESSIQMNGLVVSRVITVKLHVLLFSSFLCVTGLNTFHSVCCQRAEYSKTFLMQTLCEIRRKSVFCKPVLV